MRKLREKQVWTRKQLLGRARRNQGVRHGIRPMRESESLSRIERQLMLPSTPPVQRKVKAKPLPEANASGFLFGQSCLIIQIIELCWSIWLSMTLIYIMGKTSLKQFCLLALSHALSVMTCQLTKLMAFSSSQWSLERPRDYRNQRTIHFTLYLLLRLKVLLAERIYYAWTKFCVMKPGGHTDVAPFRRFDVQSSLNGIGRNNMNKNNIFEARYFKKKIYANDSPSLVIHFGMFLTISAAIEDCQKFWLQEAMDSPWKDGQLQIWEHLTGCEPKCIHNYSIDHGSHQCEPSDYWIDCKDNKCTFKERLENLEKEGKIGPSIVCCNHQDGGCDYVILENDRPYCATYNLNENWIRSKTLRRRR